MTKSLLCFTQEFLERCEAVTKKYELKGQWDSGIQMLKMFEEVAEVQRAILNADVDNLKEELVDVILSALTMYHKFGIEPLEIQQQLESKLLKVEAKAGIKS